MKNFDYVTDKSTPQELLNSLKEGYDAYNQIRIQDIQSDVKGDFAVWRQRLGSLVIWYTTFVNNRDYSSSVNAALALGKFSSTPLGDKSVVSDEDQNNLLMLGSLIWADIKRGNNVD